MATILIIEDEIVSRTLIKKYLKKAGYDTIEATNGAEAIKLFATEHIDLVITDIFMPEMDGLEFIRELKTSAPEIKVIAMSAGGITNQPEVYVQSAIAHGAFRGLLKPINVPELINTVEEALGSPSKKNRE